MVSGETALVTGGAGGLGAAIAAALTDAGYTVVIADSNPAAVAAVAEALSVRGTELDITDLPAVHAVVEELGEETAGGIGVLVNCAGIAGEGGSLLQQDPADLRRVLEVNVVGTTMVTRAFVAEAMKRGTSARVVTITSSGAQRPTVGLAAYEASKAALEALTRAAALEFAAHGIRVNAVAPGPIGVGMAAGLLEDESALQEWTAPIPLAKIARADDVVPMVVFLASPDAAHITGQVLTIDGGRSLT